VLASLQGQLVLDLAGGALETEDDLLGLYLSVLCPIVIAISVLFHVHSVPAIPDRMLEEEQQHGEQSKNIQS
jgi:hypothetical protein